MVLSTMWSLKMNEETINFEFKKAEAKHIYIHTQQCYICIKIGRKKKMLENLVFVSCTRQALEKASRN